MNNQQYAQLAAKIKRLGLDLGFDQVAISNIDLSDYSNKLRSWLHRGHHGDMDYMVKHGTKRYRPDELIPGTISIITVRMNYLTSKNTPKTTLENRQLGYIAQYALGRDYHKVLRKKLRLLAETIKKDCAHLEYRAFVDSGPVMEKSLAEKSGLGWIGKNTMLVNPKAGSFFLLGTLYTNLPLPCDSAVTNHCGSCQACIKACPTNAIIAPYNLDANRCIAYLTIEYKGAIPIDMRPMFGNRIFGCDDCLLNCPWNKFAKISHEQDFMPRHGLDAAKLADLFSWSEQEFLAKTAGSPIRRIGYDLWLRNIAIALGNAPSEPNIVTALKKRRDHKSALVREHVAWALARHS